MSFCYGEEKKTKGSLCGFLLLLQVPVTIHMIVLSLNRQVVQKISIIFLEHIYPASPTRMGELLSALGLVRKGSHAVLLILWKEVSLDLWAGNSLAQRQELSNPWLVQMEIGEVSTPSLDCIPNLFPVYELLHFWRKSEKWIMIFIVNSLA